MSKIQEYVDAKAVSDELAAIIETIPTDERTCTYPAVSTGNFEPLVFNVKLSPTTGAQTSNMGKYLAKAIQAALTTLMNDASDLAAADTETARLAAHDEALEVLGETG